MEINGRRPSDQKVPSHARSDQKSCQWVSFLARVTSVNSQKLSDNITSRASCDVKKLKSRYVFPCFVSINGSLFLYIFPSARACLYMIQPSLEYKCSVAHMLRYQSDMISYQ